MQSKGFNAFNERGVTLIELIVVLSVLTLVMGATISIFISMLQGQNRALKEQELFNQASYAVDYIASLVSEAKNDETGSCLGSSNAGDNYLLTNLQSGFYQGIKFISKDDDCQEFFLDTDGLLKEKKGSASAQNILSDNFQIVYARFIIDGDKTIASASGSNSIQPRVTFALKVKTTDAQNVQEKVIQTTLSQRRLNIP